MGEQNVKKNLDQGSRSHFIQCLLNDVKALEIMLEDNLIEDDIIRIGAEQEFCLLNEHWRPATNALEILDDVDDSHFTTELAKYNLEINLDPFELKGDCFSKVKNQLQTLINKARISCEKLNSKILLTGILPTISKNELQFDFMTPNPRYWALNDTIKAMRGKDFELSLKGVDELSITHESVLFEACNTSFQTHLQIAPNDFVSSYNWSQAIAGPILSMVTNSPLLLGRELWSETRIALFQQSIDTRTSSYALKDQLPRVSFGIEWAKNSIAEIYQNQIARHKILLTREIESNPLEELSQGKIPKLKALSLHNGTVYKWNRPCYGVGDGKPHLRIENRYIPSGPTIEDEIANFAFWVGVMKGRPERFDEMSTKMDFKDAKSNFIKAARYGKESILKWGDELYSATDLIKKEFMPMAHKGLQSVNIDPIDIENYLGIIEKRLDNNTGSQWQINGFRTLRKTHNRDDALLLLTQSMYENQQDNTPVSNWPEVNESKNYLSKATLVEHIMSTDLFSVNENDLAILATNIMQWKGIHHVPVENDLGEICGILTWTHMKSFNTSQSNNMSTVNELMEKRLYTGQPDTKISDAIALMKKQEIGCLPIAQENQLVGIITIKDVMPFVDD